MSRPGTLSLSALLPKLAELEKLSKQETTLPGQVPDASPKTPPKREQKSPISCHGNPTTPILYPEEKSNTVIVILDEKLSKERREALKKTSDEKINKMLGIPAQLVGGKLQLPNSYHSIRFANQVHDLRESEASSESGLESKRGRESLLSYRPLPPDQALKANDPVAMWEEKLGVALKNTTDANPYDDAPPQNQSEVIKMFFPWRGKRRYSDPSPIKKQQPVIYKSREDQVKQNIKNYFMEKPPKSRMSTRAILQPYARYEIFYLITKTKSTAMSAVQTATSAKNSAEYYRDKAKRKIDAEAKIEAVTGACSKANDAKTAAENASKAVEDAKSALKTKLTAIEAPEAFAELTKMIVEIIKTAKTAQTLAHEAKTAAETATEELPEEIKKELLAKKGDPSSSQSAACCLVM